MSLLSTALEQGLSPDIIDDTNPDDIFLGYFRYNKIASPLHCLIKRVTKETIEGKVLTRIRYPFGKFDYFFDWSNRANYYYRHRDFQLPAIGDIYGGGIVFYINPDESYVLVCSQNDVGTANQFCFGTYIPIADIMQQNNNPIDTLAGSGFTNTTKIIAALDPLGPTNYAAKLAKTFTGGGYSDWFLPTANELDQMFRNLKNFNINFHDGIAFGDSYWSSSSGSWDEFNNQKIIYRILYNAGNPSWNGCEPNYTYIGDPTPDRFKFGYVRPVRKIII